MTDEDELARLRLIDDFLDGGESDLDDWHAELERIEPYTRDEKARLRWRLATKALLPQ